MLHEVPTRKQASMMKREASTKNCFERSKLKIDSNGHANKLSLHDDGPRISTDKLNKQTCIAHI